MEYFNAYVKGVAGGAKRERAEREYSSNSRARSERTSNG